MRRILSWVALAILAGGCNCTDTSPEKDGGTCTAGASCTPTDLCKNGTVACTNGVATCQASGNKANGTARGTAKV